MGTNCMTGNFESHLLISGRGEGMQTQSITNGQWYNQSCLCKGASIKPKRDRFQSFCVSKRGDLRRVARLERAQKLHALFPLPCAMHLFHVTLSSPYFQNWHIRLSIIGITFTNWRFVAIVGRASVLMTFFLQALHHILVILAIFFSFLLYLLWWSMIIDLWCYYCMKKYDWLSLINTF